MHEGKDAYSAQFELKPLERGYGDTIGNALRRILLSSIEGYAITAIRIGGVDHEFDTISGVVEDVTNIILNLKQVRFRPIVENPEEEEITITIGGKETFTAGEFNTKLQSYEVVNEDLVICSLAKEATITMMIRVAKGRGYVPSEENRREGDDTHTIAIDSIFTPIRRVMYRHEDFRVQQKTDYEKLIIGVTTDGTIDPRKALQDAANILISHFSLFTDDKKLEVMQYQEEFESFDQTEPLSEKKAMLQTPIDECDLSSRARNCLTSHGILTLGDLISKPKDDVAKLRNFGRKSMDELTEYLETIGLDFDTDTSKL